MKKIISFFLISFCLMIGMASCSIDNPTNSSDIVIGSKSFTEQDILGELLAQQIEATTNLKVDRRSRLGGTFICHQAIVTGNIDGYVEYTGTSYNAILKQKVISNPEEVYQQVKENYDQKFNLEVMEPLGFENTYAIIIRKEDAEKYNLQNISEVSKHTSKWRLGAGYEFTERQDGLSGLVKKYNLDFTQSPQQMDNGLLYRAIHQGLVDIIAGTSTDGQISRLGLVLLEDDREYFPPYEATPVFRKDTLEKYPQLKDSIAKLSGKINAEEMRRLNSLVGGELRNVKDVVREFRKSKGL
ncbi:glycine betaine ABC transporter substrate-binding protein [Mastigocoleus sp. MO_188.B34]|uniref:glycine betaine ABC transporter substrate-binding protein n=1 Tax=Mastigocoleus sp. MO_188.B34 TaxID=3036635 RepID=UPI002619C64E|nr:glycine betaine ABC transporter substrate-binding protein [Mastigocoleus sp. MO_188.B34]MDJ0697597.1 glycine betaine ABC transporter substrate-binding protein [Mastigocoleus sp. MO_188.B34]